MHRSADVKEVRAAYLRLALCLHPDKAVRSARHAISQQQDEVRLLLFYNSPIGTIAHFVQQSYSCPLYTNNSRDPVSKHEIQPEYGDK